MYRRLQNFTRVILFREFNTFALSSFPFVLLQCIQPCLIDPRFRRIRLSSVDFLIDSSPCSKWPTFQFFQSKYWKYCLKRKRNRFRAGSNTSFEHRLSLVTRCNWGTASPWLWVREPVTSNSAQSSFKTKGRKCFRVKYHTACREMSEKD